MYVMFPNRSCERVSKYIKIILGFTEVRGRRLRASDSQGFYLEDEVCHSHHVKLPKKSNI